MFYLSLYMLCRCCSTSFLRRVFAVAGVFTISQIQIYSSICIIYHRQKKNINEYKHKINIILLIINNIIPNEED